MNMVQDQEIPTIFLTFKIATFIHCGATIEKLMLNKKFDSNASTMEFGKKVYNEKVL